MIKGTKCGEDHASYVQMGLCDSALHTEGNAATFVATSQMMMKGDDCFAHQSTI